MGLWDIMQHLLDETTELYKAFANWEYQIILIVSMSSLHEEINIEIQTLIFIVAKHFQAQTFN